MRQPVLHADILESSDSFENLEDSVCELENNLFDIWKECLRALSKEAIILELLVSPVLSSKTLTNSSSSREETKPPIISILKRFASCLVQTNCKKDVSAGRYVDKISRFSAPDQIKEDFIKRCELPLEKLSKENFDKGYSVAASNAVSNQVNISFLSKPHFSYKEPLVNFEVKIDVKKPVSTLNPSSYAFQYSSYFLNPIQNTHGTAPGT